MTLQNIKAVTTDLKSDQLLPRVSSYCLLAVYDSVVYIQGAGDQYMAEMAAMFISVQKNLLVRPHTRP